MHTTALRLRGQSLDLTHSNHKSPVCSPPRDPPPPPFPYSGHSAGSLPCRATPLASGRSALALGGPGCVG